MPVRSGTSTPRGLRLQIGLFGRRNVGKSSLLNALVGQEVSIVSKQPGTTTDPVSKAMELQPLGPVLFIDTAGLDDEGPLGEQRAARAQRVLERVDLAILVAEATRWGNFEERLIQQMEEMKVPFVVDFNKVDSSPPAPQRVEALSARGISVVRTVATTGRGMDALRQALLELATDELSQPPAIAGDLVGPGEMAVLVTPIDSAAPRGRLILPQVQVIRDLLDHGAFCVVVQDGELARALSSLNRPPRLVVTDSQAFTRVAALTPPTIPMTSFSILFARFKGDLGTLVLGTLAIGDLRPGDRILIAEACTHHPTEDDIGRVKLPRWLDRHVGGRLMFTHVRGHAFPDDVSPYRLIIHCGACMLNRRELQIRILRCRQAKVPRLSRGFPRCGRWSFRSW